jgi:hypothetical protein
MSMYQGMDLSRFKKIASDGKVSTLRHSRGHEIKIAHSGLSPKMREHLDEMPVHLAEGGDPAAIDPESPEVAEENLYPPEESAPAESQQTEAPQTETPRKLPPKPEVMPVAGTVDVVAPARPSAAAPQPPAEPTVAEDLDNEGATFADDVQRGQIHPKTMADLYAKKDTLGKIGTIFGLMIGGAGAGLTHQPNALLEMMQKEIDRDLDAQKTSNANAQNWLKLSHEYQMQKGQIGKLGAETLATIAGTSKIPSEIGETEARTRVLDADAQLKSYEAAKTRMMIGAISHLGGIVDSMPPGPARDNAQTTLNNVLKPAVISDIQNRNQRAQKQIDLRDAVRGKTKSQEPQDDGNGVDLRKMQQLRKQGAALEAAGAPGIGGMSASQEATAREEAGHVAQNRAISKMFVDAFNRLDDKFRGGVLNPGEREAEIASLSAQLAQQYGAPTQKEYDTIIRSMFPGATDWGGARDTKFRHGLEALRAREAGTSTLDMFGLKTPFPTYAREKKTKKAEKGSGTATAASGLKDGETRTSKSGKPIIFRNGKWVYK